jgi:hypothetical protein
MLKKMIEDTKSGRIQDTHGWVLEIREEEMVLGGV